MSSHQLKDTVRQYLATHHMFVDNEWLSGCVDYLCEDSSNNICETDIKNLAREQWLLNDLKDICPGCLPANLKSQAKTVINGRYMLQINAALDIGTPAYQQYLKLQKVNTENVEATTNYEDKISSHRMIKLYLTDGVQEITAIEYKPMRNLSCDITPGCKILIKGPVECRRGMLLLAEGMIELLGGEVGEIVITNCLAGLLSSKLGLPMTQASDLNTTLSQPRNTDIPAPHTQMPSAAADPPPDRRPVAVVASLQAAAFNDDDIDFEQIAHIEAQITDLPTKRPLENTLFNPEKKIRIDLTRPYNTPYNCNGAEIDLTDIPISSKIINTAKIDLTTIPKSNVIGNAQRIDLTNMNTIDDYPDDNDIFLNEDEEYLKEMEAQFYASDHQPRSSRNNDQSSKSKHQPSNSNTGPISKGPLSVSSEPYIYIKQINDLPTDKKLGRVFKVKGQIMKLLSKLHVGKEGWNLKCRLVDGTGGIDVEFSSEVLTKLVGYSPQEMNRMKKQMNSKPELKETVLKNLQKAKDTLQVLYCIIELTIMELPKITRLIPFEESHADAQRRRVDSYN